MQSRKGSWRSPLLVLTAALLSLAPLVALAVPQNRTVLRQQQPRSSEEGPGIREAFTPPEATPLKKPVLYPRTETFWAFEVKSDFGRVPVNQAGDSNVLGTRVGSFFTDGPELPLPATLKGDRGPAGGSFYLIQFSPQAFAPDKVEQSLREVTEAGAILIEYTANNGYLVKMSPPVRDALASSPSIQYVGRYHPAYKISRTLGFAPLPDAAKAASPVYSLVLRGWPGDAVDALAAEVVSLGGTVTYAVDDEAGPFVLADLHKNKIAQLSRSEAVKSIDENLPRFHGGEENAWNVIAGTYIIGTRPSLYLAGVDGSGRYRIDEDNVPTGNFPAAEDKDWNGNGVRDNASQLVADTDTGMSVDAGDMSETATSSGWNGFGGNAGPNVPRISNLGNNGAANHRKIAWYYVAPGAFGTGDTRSCHPSGSHGHVTAGCALGNASSGPFTGDGIDWTGDGNPDNYGDPNSGDICGPGFCFISGIQTFRADGVAPGARVIFQDVNSVCPEPDSFLFGSYSTLLGDARTKGARLHNFSFGAFDEGSGTLYDPSSQAIDQFLSTDTNRDYMLFISAGNSGTATDNTNGNARSGTLTNEAAAKNAVSVGANASGSAGALQSRAFFSSVGPVQTTAAPSCPQTGVNPAPSNCGRVKPDLMAPGIDGNSGLTESFTCVSSDGDQTGTVECLTTGTGQQGTSFSAPNAAGAGALIRDYFASGLYPDGTTGNTNNDGDRVSRMSGAMVKTLLICSADHMDGGGLHNTANAPNYDHRYNPEQGYGFINLRNVLPLTTDPASPSGLIVKDGGCPTGVTCADNLATLSNPIAIGVSTSAEFEVLSDDEELRVVLGWVESTNAAGDPQNNLNLELRYCGADRACGTAAGDIVYYGNVFTEDRNDDGVEDQNLDGTAGLTLKGVTGHWRSEGAWSLANRGDPPHTVVATRDASNNTEGIFLSPDPELDGTDNDHQTDNQVKSGKWLVTVTHAGGVGSQKYTVCIAGAVAVDSGIRLDTNPISCNGEVAVVVNEVPKAPATDPVCNTTACTNAAGIAARVTVKVATESGAVADQELAPTLTKDPNSFSFRSGKIPVSTVASPLVDDNVLLASDGYVVTATYADSDGTKTSQSTFDCTPNVDFTALGQPGRNAPFLLAGGCDTDKYFDNQETFTYLFQFSNLELITLDDITVTLRAVTPDSDNETDPGRLNNAPSPYVQVQSGAVLIDRVFPGFIETAGFTVTISSVPSWPASPGAPPEVEMVAGITSNKVGKSSATYGVFKHLLNANDERFLYSTDYPTGAQVDRDLNSNEKIENPIVDRRQPFPQGNQRDNVDKLNESITFSDLTTTAFGGGNPGFNGPWDFDATDKGFRSGFYAGNKGNTSEITNWGEDSNYSGTLDGNNFCLADITISCTCAGGIYPCGSGTPRGGSSCAGGGRCLSSEDFDGDQDGSLDQGWTNLGGCGFLSSNGAQRGVWHTGQIGPIGASVCIDNVFPANPASTPPACENIDTVPGTSGANLWFEILRSPVLQKVHKNADPRGLNYRVELVDWRWNMNADLQNDILQLNWEFDEDTTSIDPVDLSDGTVLRGHDDGMGPIQGGNVNLTRGFAMFTENDPDDDAAGFGQKAVFGCLTGPNINGPCACAAGLVVCADNANCTAGNNCGILRNGNAGRNRRADRSCAFQNLNATQVSVTSRLLREPSPVDDDCDNDMVNLGADGCPGLCHYDDDGDGVEDNPEEICPCFGKQDGVDQDADGRRDEGDELQRYYRCQGNTALFCSVTSPAGSDDCPLGQGPCGRFGNGRPRPYGDDTCGDGSIDESTSDRWAAETALGENGHRISQNQNWNIGTLNGPFLRFGTLEDVYDREAGNSFQAAIGFVVFEGTPAFVAKNTYGVAIDDMTVEWSESHPIEQPALQGCGGKSCSSGPRVGKLCFNNDDCGAGFLCNGATPAGSSCAALTWGTTNLYAGSGVISLNLVDFNAETTQGTFNCIPFGFTIGCGGGNCAASNDCDNDGLKEVRVEVKTPAEPNPEFARLEQSSVGSASYSALVAVSSELNAAGDSVAFLQFNGTLTPSVTGLYFDRDSGAGDINLDGTTDSPPNNGKDGCPGFCLVDDDEDAGGPDKRPGNANVNDDNNGICDYKSLPSVVGKNCTINTNCTGGGTCLNVDEIDELCGRVCTAGAASGHCAAGNGNAGAVCAAPGGVGICTAGSTAALCVADNCTTNVDCGGGGTCGVAKVQRGDDICANIDEADEQCAVVAGKLKSGLDDNCGCADNPVTAVLNAVFDVADIIVQDFTLVDTGPDGTGDGDGFADDNELVSVNLTLRNLSSFDVENVRARLTTQSSTIQCINDSSAIYGRINTLQSDTNGPDKIKFTVGPVNRTALTDIKQAVFIVTVTGTAILENGSKVPFEGTATPQGFTIDLDLDVNGAAPPAATTTRHFGFENNANPGNYTSDAAWNADWAHTFFDNQAGLHCQYNNPGNPGARSAPVGCFLRQDPGTNVPDDWHLHSVVHAGGVPDGGRDSGEPGICSGGSSPGGACAGNDDCPGKCAGGKVPGAFCTGLGTDCRGACSLSPNTLCSSNIECSSQGFGKCTNPAPGTCTSPAPGTCAGQGLYSMHSGFHNGPVDNDTVHLDNITYAYYKPTVQVGLGRVGDDRPQLDFWHQMSETDDRIFSNLSPPYSLGSCTVQILVDRDSDGTQDVGAPTDATKDGWWEKAIPWYGVQTQQRFPAGNCTYDPNDDGNVESDLFESGNPTFLFNTAGTQIGPSSTCYPEFIYGCAGDTQDPPYDPNLGQSEPTLICFPEVDTNGVPIVREGSGPGRWIQTKVDLYRYRGRQIWVRYLVSEVQFGFDTWTTGFGGGFGGNRDDGWYIDDINFRGTNAAPFTLKADSDAPPASSCPASNCSTIVPNFSGSTFITQTNGLDDDADGTVDEPEEGKFTTVTIDAALRNIELNALDTAPGGSTTTNCLNGVLQYRFCEDFDNDTICDPNEVFRDWTESPVATANPAYNETLLMNVRCTAGPPNTCGTVQDTLVVTITGAPNGNYLGIPMTARFSGLRSDPNQVCNAAGGISPGNCFEWDRTQPSSRYDLAHRLVPVAGGTWTGAGGFFDTMACATTALVCTDSDGDGRCEFNTTGLSNPTTINLSIWLVREDQGSWNEIGSCSNNPVVPASCNVYSRDTDMRTPVGPVCAPFPAP